MGIGLCIAAGSNAQQDIFEAEKTRFQQAREATTLGNGTNASPNFKVAFYRLRLELDPGIRYIRGRVAAYMRTTAATNSVSYDLSDSLRVDSVLFRGSRIAFFRPGNQTVQLDFPVSLPAGTRDSVVIYYQGAPVSNDLGSFSLSSHSGVPVLWTLSQPYGSRDWWPCRNGLDNKADSMETELVTPSAYYGTSIGVLTQELVQGGIRSTVWKHRYPVSTYLFAIAASNYEVQEDTIQLSTGKVLPLQQYVYPEAAAAWRASMQDTRRLMRMFERYFGPYPFREERYAHTQVNFGGGMEHQTNSWMGSTNMNLIAHELAHQWFGDKVTCGSWQDIWLNEGFAVFLSYMNTESLIPFDEKVWWYGGEVDVITQEPGGSVYVRDTSALSTMFSYRLTYIKSAWVVKMLRWKLGEAKFFEGVRRYLQDPALAYGFARTEDLKRNLEAASGMKLDEYFRDWVYGEGYPSYQMNWSPLGNRVQYELKQTTSHPSVNFFEMPVPVLFKNASRDTMVVIHHERNGQTGNINIGFVADTAIIDPYYELISKSNSATRTDLDAAPNSISIFPNPVRDQVNLLLRNLTDRKPLITVYNSSGQLIWKKQQALISASDLITIPAGGWPSGVYFLRVQGKDYNSVKTIVK
jgi:aminopeptidase N